MIVTQKQGPQAVVAEKKPPRVPAKPLTDFPVSPAASKISGILSNLRVCLALGNAALANSFAGNHTVIDYDTKGRVKVPSEGAINPALLDCQMTITDLATLVRMLPKLQKDVLVLHNPIDLASDSTALRSGLEAFRRANPQAVVVSAMASGDAALVEVASPELKALQRDGLVDCICSKPAATTNDLMHEAAMLVELKAEAAQKHAASGTVICDPNDVRETVVVLSEPIQ